MEINSTQVESIVRQVLSQLDGGAGHTCSCGGNCSCGSKASDADLVAEITKKVLESLGK